MAVAVIANEVSVKQTIRQGYFTTSCDADNATNPKSFDGG
jgi:hypothetical protein